MMKRFLIIIFCLFPTLAFAQSQRNPCYYPSASPSSSSGCIPVSSSNPLPVSASATISGGFTDAATGTPISVTTLGNTGTLPTGAVVAAFNVGSTNTAYCKLGASATTSDIAIPPQSWFAFQVGVNTQLTCITSTSTTTVNMVGGSGLPTGSGGGSGGGGGGSNASVSATGSVVPTQATYIGINSGGNLTGWNGAVTQGLGSVVSGAYSSGAFASGAFAAGSIASGAGVDGWDLTQGTKADTAWVSGSGSVISILKNIAGGVNGAVPAGTNTIGNVGSDPSSGKGTPSSVAINVSTATTTQLVALSGSTKIYVTSFDVIAGGTGNITFEYGTGVNCATGTTALTGAYNLAAQAGIAKGDGTGAVLVVPAGNALCVLTSAAVQMSGSVSYQQF